MWINKKIISEILNFDVGIIMSYNLYLFCCCRRQKGR